MIGIPRSNSYKRHWIDGVQCDQMAVSILGHLEQVYFAQKYKIFAKEGSQFYQILNSFAINGPKTCNILPRRQNFAKSGHTDGVAEI